MFNFLGINYFFNFEPNKALSNYFIHFLKKCLLLHPLFKSSSLDKVKFLARMAELVDALVSGTSDRKVVQVRSLFRVLASINCLNVIFLIAQVVKLVDTPA